MGVRRTLEVDPLVWLQAGTGLLQALLGRLLVGVGDRRGVGGAREVPRGLVVVVKVTDVNVSVVGVAMSLLNFIDWGEWCIRGGWGRLVFVIH